MRSKCLHGLAAAAAVRWLTSIAADAASNYCPRGDPTPDTCEQATGWRSAGRRARRAGRAGARRGQRQRMVYLTNGGRAARSPPALAAPDAPRRLGLARPARPARRARYLCAPRSAPELHQRSARWRRRLKYRAAARRPPRPDDNRALRSPRRAREAPRRAGAPRPLRGVTPRDRGGLCGQKPKTRMSPRRLRDPRRAHLQVDMHRLQDLVRLHRLGVGTLPRRRPAVKICVRASL